MFDDRLIRKTQLHKKTNQRCETFCSFTSITGNHFFYLSSAFILWWWYFSCPRRIDHKTNINRICMFFFSTKHVFPRFPRIWSMIRFLIFLQELWKITIKNLEKLVVLPPLTDFRQVSELFKNLFLKLCGILLFLLGIQSAAVYEFSSNLLCAHFRPPRQNLAK